MWFLGVLSAGFYGLSTEEDWQVFLPMGLSVTLSRLEFRGCAFSMPLYVLHHPCWETPSPLTFTHVHNLIVLIPTRGILDGWGLLPLIIIDNLRGPRPNVFLRIIRLSGIVLLYFSFPLT